MTRTNLASLLLLIIGVPAAAAATYFTAPAPPKPCFVSGQTAYRMAGADASADITVRVDNTAASPSLRIQFVDDPAGADFVLLDDNDGGAGCGPHTTSKTVRLDQNAERADLTVALAPTSGSYRIYVNSTQFSGQDGAALFAALLLDTRKVGLAARRIAE